MLGVAGQQCRVRLHEALYFRKLEKILAIQIFVLISSAGHGLLEICNPVKINRSLFSNDCFRKHVRITAKLKGIP